MGSGATPVLPAGPPPTVNVGEVGAQEIDPRNAMLLGALGANDAGTWEHLALALWAGLIKFIQPGIALFFSGVDTIMAGISDGMLAAQAQSSPGFYELIGHLITDLTGIEVDGGQLFNQFQTRGRVAAMQKIGGALIDTLASEFVGETQTDQGGVFTVARGSGIGGLPAVQITPEGGMNAARAFLGFAMSFAVREGNTDMFSHFIPWGLGEGFKDIAEDFSKSLGLGRLTRLAMKPLFQNLVAIPMTWAFNKQYTPSLLSAGESVRAFNAGLFSGEELNEELSRHGFSQQRRNALQAFHTKYPSENDLFLLELSGALPSSEHRNLLHRIGYDDDNVDLLFKAEALHTSRHLSLRLAELMIRPLLVGEIDLATYRDVLSRFHLTEGEKTDLTGFASELLSHPRRRLTFAQMTSAFVQGVVNVDEVATFLHEEGYREDDIAILLQLDLIKLQAVHAKAAAKKAKTPKPAGNTPGA